MKGLTLEEVKSEIRRIDPGIKENDDGFSVAMVLISAAFSVGPEVAALVRFTGYTQAFICDIARRMKATKLWNEEGVETEHWFDGDNWTSGIWTDSLVAQGLLEACRRDNGDWEYRAIRETIVQ
jgi:hypothetical protein